MGPLWSAMNDRPRYYMGTLKCEDIPVRPGVYACYEGGNPVYVGTGGDIQDRIWGRHLRKGRSLKTSALRRNVAEDLGFGSAADIKTGRCAQTPEQIANVNARIQTFSIAWITCGSHEDAVTLEELMKDEWMPRLTKQ